MIYIVFSFLFSFLIAALSAPLVIKLYKHFKWLDNPSTQKHVKITHTAPVPRGGGIVIFLPVALIMLLFLPKTPEFIGMFIAMVGLLLMGIYDDVTNASPYLRLVVGLLLSSLVVFSGVTLDFITNPLQTGIIDFQNLQLSLFSPLITVTAAHFLAILWILWNMNIVNWSKGLDGQLPGVVSIAAFFIGILALRFAGDPTQTPVIILSFAVAGSYAGLLLWNAYPQRIMPGYGAGSLGGFFLAVLSMLSGAKLATALLVLAIPTADAIFTISRRIVRKKSPFWGDRGHFHHKLLDVFGWSKPRIAWFYWLTTALFGVLALQLKPSQKLFTIAVITALVFGFLIWVKLFISSSNQRDRDNG